MTKLVVVESPAKAKTINSYLGKDYEVIASYGHIRDLPTKQGSVIPEQHFKMMWEVNDRGKKQLKEIIGRLKSCDELLLATDPIVKEKPFHGMSRRDSKTNPQKHSRSTRCV